MLLISHCITNPKPIKMNVIKITISSLLALFVLLTTTAVKGQEVIQDFQSRSFVSITYKPIKKLKFSVTPELRMDETFSVDKYFIEADAQYKLVKFASLGASYRFVVNPREVKETEYLNRFAIHLKLSQKVERFKFSLKTSFTNYNDDLTIDKYLRYKLKAEYNIPKLPLIPFVAAEAFHQISYSQFSKMRYATGMEYKFSKHHALDVSYKLDYYLLQYQNRHILSLGYTYKL